MKVKQLIEELQKCNPEAECEIDMSDFDEDNIFVKGIESLPTIVTIIPE